MTREKTPLLAPTSTHAIRYKVRSTVFLRRYVADSALIMQTLANWFHDSLTDERRKLALQCVTCDAKKAASNLAPFFLKKEHKITVDLTTAYDDSPPTHVAKQEAMVLRKSGILPLATLSPLMGQQSQVVQLLYGAIMAFKSWYECNELAKAEYAALEQDCATAHADIEKHWPVEWLGFKDWLAHCEPRYFRITKRIASAVANGKLWWDNGQEITDKLTELCPMALVPFKTRTLLEHFTKIELKNRKLQYMRPEARWTPPTAEKLSLSFMDSMPRFSLAWHDQCPQITLILALRSQGSYSSIEERLDLCKSRRGHYNRMLTDVVVVGTKRPYALTYRRRGRNMSAECKCITLSQKDGELFAQLTIQCANAPAHKPYAGAAAPSAPKKPAEQPTRKQRKHKPRPPRSALVPVLIDQSKAYHAGAKHNELTVMGVDLGIRNLATYEVMHQDTSGNRSVIDSGILHGPTDKAMGGLIRAIEQTTAVLRKVCWAARQTGWFDCREDERHVQDLGLVKHRPVPELDISINDAAKYLKDLVKKARQQRCFSANPSGQWMQYAAALRDARRALVGAHTIGYNRSLLTVAPTKLTTPTPKPANGHASDVIHTEILTYLAGFKRNLIKKLATSIADKANEHKVHVVVLEDLSAFKPDNANAPGKNRMLSLWSHRMIADTIRHACALNGIAVQEVDPRHTSQIDCHSGEFGYREKKNGNNLWVMCNNQLACIHADRNAAENIAVRYLSRYVRLHYARTVGDGQILIPVAVCADDDNDTTPLASLLPEAAQSVKRELALGARITGAIYKLTGHNFCKFELTAPETYKIIGIDKADYEAIASGVTSQKVTELYNHNGEFVTSTKHRQLTHAIAKAANVLSGDQGCGRMGKQRREAEMASMIERIRGAVLVGV